MTLEEKKFQILLAMLKGGAANKDLDKYASSTLSSNILQMADMLARGIGNVEK